MTNTMKKMGLGLATVLVLAPSLKADDGKAFLGGGAAYANDSVKRATNQKLGLNLNGGWDFLLPATNTTFRLGLGLTILSGKEGTFTFAPDPNDPENRISTISKTTLYNVQATGDLLIGTPWESVKVVTGFSLNQWRYQASSRYTAGGEAPHPYGLQPSKAPGDLKVGFRIGADFKLNKAWSGEVILQMVEFGAPDSEAHLGFINPSWVQFGVKYHF